MTETLLLPHGMRLTFAQDGEVGTVSDGYHTFDELYQHRCLLYCFLSQHVRCCWKSKLHEDGSAFDGWFIAGMTLAVDGALKDITYHLPVAMWDTFRGTVYPRAPAWDGHTSTDVLQRMHTAVTGLARRGNEARDDRDVSHCCYRGAGTGVRR